MNYETLIYDVSDKILTITLNRPDKLNAFTGTMCTDLLDAFDRADADDAISAIVVTGAGQWSSASAPAFLTPPTPAATLSPRENPA